MRILQIHNYYALLGGEDTIADTEALILEQGGHTVERVRARNPAAGAAAIRALSRAPWSRSWYEEIRVRAGGERFDVAHLHNTWYAITPAVVHALKDRGIPVVMELQNYRQICLKAQLFRNGGYCTDCVGKHPWRGVFHRCYRSSAIQSAVVARTITRGRARGTWDLVDRYVAPSEFVKSVFVEAGTAADRITVKPSVVPDAGPRSRPPSRSPTVLYAGRLHPEKGVDVLLEAWRKARGELGELELEVIGDGPLRERLERAAPSGVRFAGHVTPDELSQRMLGARALVFPSQWPETFGRTIVEGFSAGLPALATDFAGPGELARQLGSSWVTDPARWASALPRLLDDEAIDDAGRRARDLYEGKYTPQAGLRRLEAVYEAVLSGAEPVFPLEAVRPDRISSPVLGRGRLGGKG